MFKNVEQSDQIEGLSLKREGAGQCALGHGDAAFLGGGGAGVAVQLKRAQGPKVAEHPEVAASSAARL